MKILQTLLLACGLAGFGTQAAWAETVEVNVNGMVCAFCVKAIEKTFGATEGVQSVAVNLDAKQIKLDLKPGATMSDAALTEKIRDAGYTVVSIVRHE